MRSLSYYHCSPQEPPMSYSIVNFCEEQMEIIKTFDSYEAADAAFDEWSERLPHAWLEIVSTAEAESVV